MNIFIGVIILVLGILIGCSFWCFIRLYQLQGEQIKCLGDMVDCDNRIIKIYMEINEKLLDKIPKG